jgi:hypothetical protein
MRCVAFRLFYDTRHDQFEQSPPQDGPLRCARQIFDSNYVPISNRLIAETRYEHGTLQDTSGRNFVPKRDLSR